MKDRIVSVLLAKSRRERVIFWALVLTLFLSLAFGAHSEGVGWQRCNCMTTGGVVWDLNPALWAPYGISGDYRVWIDPLNDPHGRTSPPEQYPTLYFLTFLYWLFLALVLSKVLTLVGRRVLEHRAEGREKSPPET